jgi:hypothetical protein
MCIVFRSVHSVAAPRLGFTKDELAAINQPI